MAPRRPPFPWLKPGLLVGGLIPFAVLVWRAARGTLGADAIAFGLNQLGYLALVFLMASLACTPLKTLTGWTWPIRIRRMLGLFAFFYASLHLLTYVGIDQQLDWAVLWGDVTQRKFMIIGFLAFLCLVPLVWTSTDASVRRLGFARWKKLHRLAYLAGVLAVVHFIWRVKLDLRVPLTWAAILGALFLVRIADEIRTRRRKRARQPVAARSVDLAG